MKYLLVALSISVITQGAFTQVAVAQEQTPLEQVCPTIVNSFKGWLLKPKSQDSGGTREGKPMILISSNNPGVTNFLLYDTAGEVICRYHRYYKTLRWYVGWGKGCKKTASKLLAQVKASNGGNKTLYLKANGNAKGKHKNKCLKVKDLGKRRDMR